MNFKNRVMKLEEKLNMNSEFCNCSKEIVFEIIPFGVSVETAEPKKCEMCRKPVPVHPPVTFALGNLETNIIYPTMDYNREEFEENDRIN